MTSSFVTNLDSIRPHAMDDVFLWQYYANKGLVVNESDFGFESIETLLEKLTAAFPEGRQFDFRDYNRRFFFETNDFAIVIPNVLNRACAIFAKSHEVLIGVLGCLEGNVFRKIDPKSVSVVYYYPARDEVGQNWITIKIADIPTVIPELYPSINVGKLAEAFKKTVDPILLLYGVPGVGKTTFLKFLLSTGHYKNVAYVKDISIMHKGEFWSHVASAKHDMLIFDDLDFALAPRKEGDKGFVSNLLSYSDGIFSSKTKVVITTNQPIERIDGALVRPGRCFDFLTLEPLSFAEGQEVWTTVLGMDLTQYETLYAGQDLVTQAAIMSDYRRLLSQSQDREYLKRGNRRYSIEQKMQEAGVAVFHPQDRSGFTRKK